MNKRRKKRIGKRGINWRSAKGRERKKNVKQRGRVKEDNIHALDESMFQSKCKNVPRSLRMYTTDVFSLSYLEKKKKKKSLSKMYITLLHI